VFLGSPANPARRIGVIDAIADATISGGWNASTCGADQSAPMDPATYQAALLDFRAQMAALIPDGVSSGKSGTPRSGKSGTPLKGARDGAKRS